MVFLITVLLVASSRGNGSIQEEGSFLCSGGPQLTLVLQLEGGKQELRPSGCPPAWGIRLVQFVKSEVLLKPGPIHVGHFQHSHFFLFPFSCMCGMHVCVCMFACMWAHLHACRSLRLTLGIILDCSLWQGVSTDPRIPAIVTLMASLLCSSGSQPVGLDPLGPNDPFTGVI